MIDSKFLQKRFGIDVILQNLSPEERYVCTNKNILNDSSLSKIDHIQNSVFDDSNDILGFVSEVLDTDINLDTENLSTAINELLKIFSDYSITNPFFDPKNMETWCDGAEKAFLQCRGVLDQCGMLTQNVVVLDESSNVSSERIKQNVYNELDDNSIILLFGLLTGAFPSSYSPDMRDTVFNDIDKNRENSRIGKITLHSLKENESENIGNILCDYDIDTCKKAQTNGTVIFDELGCIKSISKVGDNKYVVDVLNEDGSTLTDEDKEKIRLAGSMSDYKELLANDSGYTVDRYVADTMDMLYDEHDGSATRFYNRIFRKFPDLAKQLASTYKNDLS